MQRQKAAAYLPASRQEMQRLQGEAEKALAQAEALQAPGQAGGPACMGDEDGQA